MRWPGLDGLRGLAVAAVVVFHMALGPGANGYVGVDVFFALSGFLITSLLLREHAATGRVVLRAFYARRVLRLYPALVLACLGVLLIGVVGHRLGAVAPASVAALAYAANWWIYLGHPAPLLDHTWTLAIEEHYYLVWPVLLLGLLSRRRPLQSLAAVGVVALGVLLSVRWPGTVDAVRLSYLRGAPIVWGSLLALALRAARPHLLLAEGASPRSRSDVRGATHPVLSGRARVARLAGWALLGGLLVICFTPTRYGGRFLEGVTSVPGALATALVAVIVVSGGPAILSWVPLRWLGQRSYGIYLYHFPILGVLRHQLSSPAIELRMLLGVVVTLVAAEASYRLVETPFLRIKDRFSARAPAAAGTTGG